MSPQHVVIAGGHGQIALHTERLLAERGDRAVGLVRNPDHVADVVERGAEAVVLDLEHSSVDEVAAALEGADAVIFAAGAGPDSGPERKETVDKGGAILLADAAEQAGVRRYVIVSSMGAETADPDSEEVFAVYLRAKKAADDDLRSRDLDWTVVRPGRLTDDDPTGLVAAGDLEYGEIPRADVAAALVACLDEPATVRRSFDLVGGESSVAAALSVLGAAQPPG